LTTIVDLTTLSDTHHDGDDDADDRRKTRVVRYFLLLSALNDYLQFYSVRESNDVENVVELFFPS
jgi:hypothetical protein